MATEEKKEPEKKKDSEKKAEPEKKKGGIPKLAILGGLVLILAVAGFVGYTLFFKGHKSASSTNATTEKTTEEAPKGEKEHGKEGEKEKGAKGKMVSLPPFVVNLADPAGRRFLKIGMDLEMADEKSVEELKQSLPKVKDTLLLLLSSKTYESLSSMEDKLLLKKDIEERLSQIIGPSKVSSVYFTEFVIQ